MILNGLLNPLNAWSKFSLLCCRLMKTTITTTVMTKWNFSTASVATEMPPHLTNCVGDFHQALS